MTRKTTAYGRNRGRQIAERKRKAAEDQAARDFDSQLRTTRLKLYTTGHGDDATELVAALMVVIGTPCEAGARQFGRDAPWVRQLHGALRTLQAMCHDGYTWKAEFADAIDRAIEVAEQNSPGLQVDHFQAAWIEANGLAMQVLNHQIDAEAIA